MRLHYDIDSLDARDRAFIERIAGLVGGPLRRYFSADVRGLDRIPDGPCLYVGNHNSGTLTADSFVFGSALCEARGFDALPYGLGHELAISFPILHQIAMPLGAVRASHENADRLFAEGHKIIVYPGGDLEAMRPYRDRDCIVFGGRQGYIRLALRAGVPIVPVVTAGGHETYLVIDDLRWLARLLRIDRLFRIQVMPLALSIPWGLTIGPTLPHFPLPTPMLIETLPPIAFERSGPEAAGDDAYVAECAALVEGQMQAALTRLADERRARGGGLLDRIKARFG